MRMEKCDGDKICLQLFLQGWLSSGADAPTIIKTQWLPQITFSSAVDS
jgi:hypothetical protein